jgi:hypothetical protein
MISGGREDSNELDGNKRQQDQQIDSQSPKGKPDSASHFDPWHTSVCFLFV